MFGEGETLIGITVQSCCNFRHFAKEGNENPDIFLATLKTPAQEDSKLCA